MGRIRGSWEDRADSSRRRDSGGNESLGHFQAVGRPERDTTLLKRGGVALEARSGGQ